MILLDLMLPGIPGEIVLDKINAMMDIPIIGVSAKTDIDSKVNLIRNGADDYITKPFDNQELLVRIEAVLRRFQKSTGSNNGKMLHFKDLSLDTEAMEAKIGNTTIALTRYEYLILQLLMSAPQRYLQKTIFLKVYGMKTLLGMTMRSMSILEIFARNLPMSIQRKSIFRRFGASDSKCKVNP